MKSATESAVLVFNEEITLTYTPHEDSSLIETYLIEFNGIVIRIYESSVPGEVTVNFEKLMSRTKIETTERSNCQDVARKIFCETFLKDNVICNSFKTNHMFNSNFLQASECLNVENFKHFRSAIGVEIIEFESSLPMWLVHLNPKHLRSITVYTDEVKSSIADSLKKVNMSGLAHSQEPWLTHKS